MKTGLVGTFFGGLLIVCVCAVVFAGEVPPAPPAEVAPTSTPVDMAPGLAPEGTSPASQPGEAPQELRLTLQECVELGLRAQAGQGNYSLQIARLDPEIARTSVTEAEAAFDPTLSLSTLFSDSASLSATALSGAAMSRQKTWSFGGTLSQTFKTGTRAELSYQTVRSKTNSSFVSLNPNYNSDFGLTITQPLLRNAGRAYNTAQIRLANNSLTRSEYDLRNTALQLVHDITQAYWNLVYAIENLEVARKSLALSEGVLSDNRKRLAVGSIAPLEVAGAEADVEKRKQDIILAQAAIAQARDDLRNLINSPSDNLENDLAIIPADSATLVVEPVNTFDAIREALAWRPDLRQASIDVSSSDINIVVAKNQLLPEVDLVATYNRNGLGGNLHDAHRDLFDNGHTRDWQGELDVQIPLGNRAARSVYTRSKLQKSEALLAYENTRRNIIVQVRAAVRDIETALATERAAEFAKVFAEKNVIAEQRKFEVGTSTSLDVLNAQDQLSQARSTELQAIINYHIALVTLEQKKGTLLERVGVTVGPAFSPDHGL